MNLDELQSARDRERQTDKLQQLRESFYADAGQFVTQLRAERDRAAERADDPWNSPEATRLNDEIETATQLVEDIYERRIGKLVKAASLDAADLATNVDGMTAEEQELFDVLVSDIKRHREHVVETISGTTQSSSESTQSSEASATHSADEASATHSVDTDGTPQTQETTAESPHGQSAEPSAPSQSETSRSAESMAADAMGGGGETPTPPQPSEFAPEAATHADDTADDVAVPTESSSTTETSASETSVPETSASETSVPETSASDASASETPPSEHPSHRESEAGGHRSAATDTARSSATQEQPESVSTQEPSGRIGDGGVSRERVLVTDDVGTFLGFDERDYDLAADDVVTLPSPNAEILVNRDVARRL